ncbi:MAG TPA: pyridoxal-dependent decarboxylase [Gemmatimonadaceae bacterium]|nr:pyridoxal-dependent decarboxylase [Gemmatimonadaceae bacterium]
MRESAAELGPEEFRALGHDLVDRIAELLTDLRQRPVAPDTSPARIRSLIGGDGVPESGEDPKAILNGAADLLFDHSTFNGHPRFFGYITSSASPIGALSDLLAASVNANCGAWQLSPVATEIERQSVRWVAELIGFPGDSGGLLVSGGNMANMVCLMAAIRAKATWDMRKQGAASAKRLMVYASVDVHTWLHKGADLCGIGTDSVRAVAVDESRAMRLDDLRRQIAADRAAGLQPAVVVGTAGSVGVGAIDPLPELARLCADEGLWFHVDGAYGAPAAVLLDAPAPMKGIALADSVAVDPHKWLYAPIEAGCSLVRDPRLLQGAFSFHPTYYHFDGSAEDPPTNFYEWGPQNTRGFRALKVWATIRQVGREGYRRMIADDIALSRAMFDAASRHAELEALTQHLSIATFRYVPRDLVAERSTPRASEYLNRVNTEILARLQQQGRVFVSNAVLDDVFALRACIVNFRTELSDALAVIEETARVGAEVDREFRVRY